MRKFYYANVEISCVEYFEKNLEEQKDNVKVVKKSETPLFDKDGTQYISYLLEADEGIIDPKWELKLEKGL